MIVQQLARSLGNSTAAGNTRLFAHDEHDNVYSLDAQDVLYANLPELRNCYWTCLAASGSSLGGLARRVGTLVTWPALDALEFHAR